MSPRSEDLLLKALARLDDARFALADDRGELTVSAAYYASFYAARAALSEGGEQPKTHRGTWSRVHEALVASGRLDRDVVRAAAGLQRTREQADYEAESIDRETAESAVRVATTFVEAVRRAIGDD